MNKLGKMGNCFPFIRKHQKGNREITLAILGIDNAGKTTTAKTIQGESIEGIAPTVGFDRIEFAINKFNISLFDLGGGKNIRAIWKNYLSEVHGLIYVIDSSDSSRMVEARENLSELLSNEKVKEKPVLLLANKQDKESALDEGEIVELLDLMNLINQNRIPCRLERCAADFSTSQKLDKSIKKGLQWLLGYVEAHLEELLARVNADMTAQQQIDEEERLKKRERIRRNRAEREMPDDSEEHKDQSHDGNPPAECGELKDNASEMKAKHRTQDLKSRFQFDDKGSSQTSNLEEPLPPPVLAGSGMRGQFYSPRGPMCSENEPRRPHMGPIKPAHRLEPLEPVISDTSDSMQRKKKKKRSRMIRKNRLAPDPLGGEDVDDTESEEGGSGMSRTPSRPDLFVTEKIYTLDEIDEHEGARPFKCVGPNGDNEFLAR